MGQPLVPHSGYRQKQAKLFNYVKTLSEISVRQKRERLDDAKRRLVRWFTI